MSGDRASAYLGAAARDLRVAKTLAPGRDGTQRLARDYGERLVCVRHRYDDANGLRVTTAELVAAVDPLRGSVPPPQSVVAAWERMWLRLAPDERALRRQILEAGGRWNPTLGLWAVPRWRVARLGLRDRVVEQAAGKSGLPAGRYARRREGVDRRYLAGSRATVPGRSGKNRLHLPSCRGLRFSLGGRCSVCLTSWTRSGALNPSWMPSPTR